MDLRILYLEPFYGGSHRDFADGLIEHSRHSYDLYTLPARFWKWRMRGAALYFARAVPNPRNYDLVLTSDMQSISDLKTAWGPGIPPIIVYFHENQLSYPVPKGEERDNHFGFTDITSCLAADRILFNSRFHFDTFFSELPRFIRKMPEYKPHWVVETIIEKSSVLYPGCRFPVEQPCESKKYTELPLIVWNHRWEFDKQPEQFFRVLEKLDHSGVPFALALAGENFQVVPKPFIKAKKKYGARIVQYGYMESKSDYFDLLAASDIVVSTAIQENFGISVLEAVYSGCFPLLPKRLSYPELIPKEYHPACLYGSEQELLEKLGKTIENGIKVPAGLAEAAARYGWNELVSEYDRYFEAAFGDNKG